MALSAGQVALTSARLGRLRLDAGRLDALLAAPTAPRTPTPADGASASPFTLAWVADGATTFDVYVGTTPAPPLVASNHPDATYALPPLTAAVTYSWRIVARNAFGTVSGPVWSFTAVAPAVGSPTPADGATGVSATPTLAWTGTGETYSVYFGAAGTTPLPLVTSTAATSYAPGPLNHNTAYAWRIEAVNNAGTASGATWTFQTAALAAPANPTPANNAAKVPTEPLALTWTASPGAFGYDVYFGVAGAGPLALVAVGLPTPSWTTGELEPATRYLWRVVARGAGAERTGPVWAFTTESETALVATIDGVTPHMRLAGLTVTDALNDAPNTCTFSVDTDPPHVGQEVKIGLGSLDPAALLFAGTIDTVEDSYEGLPRHRVWTVQCIDYLRRLNRYKVRARYGQQSATAIAQDLVATYGLGFTSGNVAADLPIVAGGIDFTDEDLATCLKRLAQRIGGYFYVDYARDVHLFLSELTEPPEPIEPGRRNLLDDPAIARTVDLTQIRTRVYVEGGGSAARNSVEVGATTIAVTDGSWYPETGLVVSGPQRIRYTAKGIGGGPAAPTVAAQAVAGALLNGPYSYKVAIVTEGLDGPLSAASSAVTLPAVADPATAPTISDPAGYLDPPALTFNVYSPQPGGAMAHGNYEYRWTLVTATGETTIAPVGGGSYPYANIDGPPNQSAQVTVPTAPGGVTSRNLYRRVFSSGADYRLVLTVAGNGSVADVIDGKADASLGKPAPTTNTTGGGSLGVGTYRWRVTFVTATGETDGGPVASAAITKGGASLSNIPTTADPRVTARRLYRSAAGGTDTKLETTLSGGTTTYESTKADSALGAPFQSGNRNTASGQVQVTNIPTGPAGTQRRLYRTSAGGGAYQALVVINDNTTTTYLDNIPDDDLGDTAAGDVVTELTGIPASGPGAVLYPIRISDDVNLVAECNDVAAQAELAALEGGDSDGIYEYVIQDRRLSAAEATATGNADLALFARPIVVVRYATRDPRTRSGKTVTIDLPTLGLSGEFMIQRVQIDQIGISERVFPRYTVEASSTRYSFEDLLRQVLLPGS